MKRIAANKILINTQTIFLNAVVEYDEKGVVRRVFELSNCPSEPASTCFYNGLITTEVAVDQVFVGASIPLLIHRELAVGYDGQLVLWQNINLSTLKVTSDTKMTVL